MTSPVDQVLPMPIFPYRACPHRIAACLRLKKIGVNGMAIYSVRSRARFREFVHTLGRVVAKPTHQRVCAVATRRNTQN